MSNLIGNIASFESMGLLDGPGVRFVVFLQGCPLRCLYCHNPEMWQGSEKKYLMTPDQLVEKIKRYKPYFAGGGGVTISGGEPLMQAEFVTEVFKLCKSEGIHTCLDTSGVGKNFDKLLDYTDLVILDIKAVDSKEYMNLTKQKMDLFQKFLKICQEKNKKMWLRQVIVPGINDNEEHILKLKEFISPLKNIERVELLPYHTMAKKKYAALKIDYSLKDTPEMDKERCKQLEDLLKN